MKHLISTALLAYFVAGSGAVHAQAKIESNLDASLRLGLELRTEPDAELVWDDYESRIRWTGGAQLEDGLKAISYLEFGFDQNAGVNVTRQAWVGVEGNFGTVTGGKQYRAFYDAIDSATDVDVLDGCELGIACDRQASIVKYASPVKDDLQFMASANLGTLGIDGSDDFIDGLDVAAILQRGDLTLGAAVALNLEDDAGAGFGLSASMPYRDGTASAVVQFASEDFANQSGGFANNAGIPFGVNDNVFGIIAAYKQEDIYARATIANLNDVAFGIEAGYIMPIIDDVAFIYFEAGITDTGVDGDDTNVFGRGVFVYNFDVFQSAN